MNQRRLDDRIENYEESIEGKCSCGEPVIKTIGSDVSIYRSKVRFHYPGNNTAYNIFRCRGCNEPIEETWKKN